MADLSTIVIYSFVSGITIFIGGLFARIEKFPDNENKERFLHGVVAFGGGVLIAAVAFVLAPNGLENLSIPSLIAFFILGSITFCWLDETIERQAGTLAQLMAMLMDFIPEALALGCVFAHDPKSGLLLAFFIGLQNLPEGFNSYKDLMNSGFSANQSLLILTPLSFIGIIASCIGYIFLTGYHLLISGIMVFAGGGIIYLTFQDIAPMSKMRKHWTPALGASLGFLIGMLGKKILG